jgi:hypothetical protein
MERMKTAKDLRALLEEAHALDQKRKAEGKLVPYPSWCPMLTLVKGLIEAPRGRGTLFVDYRRSINRGISKWRPAIIATGEPGDGSLAKDVQRLLNKVLLQEKNLETAGYHHS